MFYISVLGGEENFSVAGGLSPPQGTRHPLSSCHLIFAQAPQGPYCTSTTGPSFSAVAAMLPTHQHQLSVTVQC
jgi:hypothetical protein